MAIRIKIRDINETNDVGNFVRIPVGDIFVEVKRYEDDASVWMKVEIPLPSRGGGYWTTDTYVDARSNVDAVILQLFRRAVGFALSNATDKALREGTYAMRNFAEWENSILDDREAIAGVADVIQRMSRVQMEAGSAD